MNRTVVFFHAHPDDEALLTGGTMARLAAGGHRVVLVTATAGEAGLASAELSAGNRLGDLRQHELSRSARILGCARVVLLGYADSGMAGRPSDAVDAFARIDPETAARRLAGVLDEEGAAALTIYDPAGGYGHPDHVHVHRVGRRAAALANTPLLLDATVDRRALQRAVRIMGWARPRSPDLRASRFARLYTDPDHITHCVDVSAFLPQKRAAMRAHVSQTTADGVERNLALFLRLPAPLFRLAFGREWFVEHGRPATKPRSDDILDSLGGD
jgi:LmbE family N-acetylglucosaminyl deacetylase